MIDIIEIIDETQKMNITDEILHKLPNWFGIESSIQEYMKDVRDKIFYAAISHGKVIGFICLRHVNPFTAELRGISQTGYRLYADRGRGRISNEK